MIEQLYLWANPGDGNRYLFTGDTFTTSRSTASLPYSASTPTRATFDDVCATLDRLDAETSDVICPGLMAGTIHAFAWDEVDRHLVIDHARRQLPSGSTHGQPVGVS